MEVSTIDINRIATFRKALSAMSKINESFVFVGSKEKISLRTVNSTESILCSIDFNTAFFDSYSFLLGESIIVEVPFTYIVQILRMNWDTMKISLNSREKITFTFQDQFGSIHKFDIFASNAVIMDTSVDPAAFSVIDCNADVLEDVSNILSQSSISVIDLSSRYFQIMSEDLSTVILKVKQSEKVRVDARFNRKKKMIFGDMITALKIAKKFSDKVILSIYDEGPIVVSADIAGIISMQTKIATMDVQSNNTEKDENEESILTTPEIYRNKEASRVRVEAPPSSAREQRDKQKKRIYS